MKHLLEGYRAFRAGRWPIEREHYEALAKRGQNPEYLVISCSDSRADPATIFELEPRRAVRGAQHCGRRAAL